jgi:hypothetical protein
MGFNILRLELIYLSNQLELVLKLAGVIF